MRCAAAFLTIVLAGCATSAFASASAAGEPPDPLGTVRPTASASPAPESATDLLDCDGPVSPIGGSAGDFGPSGFGATPDSAFESWSETNLFTVPRSGYDVWGRAGERSVYTYSSDGRIKVVVVISPRFNEFVGGQGFTIEELRTCDPADHCGWQSARIMHREVDGVLASQYLRDPLGVFGGIDLLDTYDEDVEMPDDATFSGYRTDDGRELWFTETDRAAYVVTPDGIERWPRPRDIIGCS